MTEVLCVFMTTIIKCHSLSYVIFCAKTLFDLTLAHKWKWHDIRPSMVTHTRNLCSAFNPSKVHTHSSEHTHREHLSRGIEGGESGVYSLPHPQFLPDLSLELSITSPTLNCEIKKVSIFSKYFIRVLCKAIFAMWFYQLLATVNSTFFDFQNKNNNLLLLFNLQCKQSFILKLRVSYEEVSSRMGVFKAEPFTRPRPCLQYCQIWHEWDGF